MPLIGTSKASDKVSNIEPAIGISGGSESSTKNHSINLFGRVFNRLRLGGKKVLEFVEPSTNSDDETDEELDNVIEIRKPEITEPFPNENVTDEASTNVKEPAELPEDEISSHNGRLLEPVEDARLDTCTEADSHNANVVETPFVSVTDLSNLAASELAQEIASGSSTRCVVGRENDIIEIEQIINDNSRHSASDPSITAASFPLPLSNSQDTVKAKFDAHIPAPVSPAKSICSASPSSTRSQPISGLDNVVSDISMLVDIRPEFSLDSSFSHHETENNSQTPSEMLSDLDPRESKILSKSPLINCVDKMVDASDDLCSNDFALDKQVTDKRPLARIGPNSVEPFGIPLPNTYAAATNLAAKFPEIASEILALPLSGVSAPVDNGTLVVCEATVRNADDVLSETRPVIHRHSEHTTHRPNWALAPSEPGQREHISGQRRLSRIDPSDENTQPASALSQRRGGDNISISRRGHQDDEREGNSRNRGKPRNRNQRNRESQYEVYSSNTHQNNTGFGDRSRSTSVDHDGAASQIEPLSARPVGAVRQGFEASVHASDFNNDIWEPLKVDNDWTASPLPVTNAPSSRPTTIGNSDNDIWDPLSVENDWATGTSKPSTVLSSKASMGPTLVKSGTQQATQSGIYASIHASVAPIPPSAKPTTAKVATAPAGLRDSIHVPHGRTVETSVDRLNISYQQNPAVIPSVTMLPVEGQDNRRPILASDMMALSISGTKPNAAMHDFQEHSAAFRNQHRDTPIPPKRSIDKVDAHRLPAHGERMSSDEFLHKWHAYFVQNSSADDSTLGLDWKNGEGFGVPLRRTPGVYGTRSPPNFANWLPSTSTDRESSADPSRAFEPPALKFEPQPSHGEGIPVKLAGISGNNTGAGRASTGNTSTDERGDAFWRSLQQAADQKRATGQTNSPPSPGNKETVNYADSKSPGLAQPFRSPDTGARTVRKLPSSEQMTFKGPLRKRPSSEFLRGLLSEMSQNDGYGLDGVPNSSPAGPSRLAKPTPLPPLSRTAQHQIYQGCYSPGRSQMSGEMVQP
ncbi:hypothetical protein BD410DRAFT_892562 [Rickenella mellea]|uniref:Uncharacterized protein n=1 Tax=Rickenella mellea TaxID=50990 RepID=A0A4R5XEQ2_9AGAM|nr:hypothetical protein BD410DRAFT_892562 [Rickenella mellea]